jgi:hypothetical protein
MHSVGGAVVSGDVVSVVRWCGGPAGGAPYFPIVLNFCPVAGISKTPFAVVDT